MTERRGEIGAQGWGNGQLQSNQPELADLVFRSLDLKGRLPLELDREYQLGMTVEDLTRPEFYRARRRAYWGASHSMAALAANLNFFQLIEPTGEVLTVVERVIISSQSADSYGIAIVPALAALARPVRSLDNRNGVGPLSGSSTFQADQAAVGPVGTGSLVVRVAAGTTLVVEGPWILAPTAAGTSCLAVQNQGVNIASQVGFVWTERHATQSELR